MSKFIILARSRTGSNLLASFLNSHPKIHVEGEIFVKLNGKPYKEILNYGFREIKNIKAIGFKLFYYHPMDVSYCPVWNDLKAMKDLKVIHLKRKDFLRTFVSWKIAKISNVWSCRDKSKLIGKKIHVDKNELIKEFEATKKQEADGDFWFKNNYVLTIFYEDLIENLQLVFNSILNFIGISDINFIPSTTLIKQNSEQLCELIENYEEIKNFGDIFFCEDG